eukprot:CAMPEP_0113486244 /NCGR_PEP_ID=MMETSP0014_2-20120614/24896_1 /TAXON_ID=2857 /ORGANISM="Nitzschia sp." /LENGTH=992 /DNA_ID=CAMNT_0000379909 /DNA_START=67 /DNA_END=3042 /DNA_ORIENTATION=- /assembly_acc=CAM_ASM_000159
MDPKPSTEIEAELTKAGTEVSVRKMEYDSDQDEEGKGKLRSGRPGAGGGGISMMAIETEPIVESTVQDHFTLPISSNIVRFRKKQNAARIFEENDYQVVLEETRDDETGKHSISVKRMANSTAGTSILRLAYTVVCALWTGFLFVVCLSVLLFLVLDLGVETGATSLNATPNVGNTIGVILAIIVFVLAFAEALVISGGYVLDVWSGHFLVKKFVFNQLSNVAVDWIFFCFFLLFPLLIMCFSLLARSPDWWRITAISWFVFVMAFFVLFAANVVYYEVRAAYEFCKNRCDDDDDSSWSVLKRCILLRQVHNYSGVERSAYIARSVFTTTEDTEDVNRTKIYEETRQSNLSIWARFTKTYMQGFYEELEPPQRLYTIEDVQDYRPFMTHSTWSLERVFCRPNKSRYIAVVQGPGSLTRQQLKSSFVCSLIGTALIVLIFVSFLVWFEISGIFVFLAFLVVLCVALNTLRNTYALWKLSQDLIKIRTNKKEGNDIEEVEDDREEISSPDGDQSPEVAVGQASDPPAQPKTLSQRVWEKSGKEPSEGAFLVVEYKRVTEAQPRICWIMMTLEIAIFFVWPNITLFIISWNVGALFLPVSIIWGIRHYVNAAVIIEETGNMDLVDGTGEKKWENKSRLNTIIETITRNRSKKLWLSILGVGGFAFLAIFLGAVGSSTENTSDATPTPLYNFTYPPQADDMRYASCQISNIRGGFGSNATMADYVYMAGAAYLVDAQGALDNWFGEGVVVNEEQLVDDFRDAVDEGNSAVFFKLFNFTNIDLAVISIRGTTTPWDMLADAQLWAAASLMQGVRVVLPIGEIWTPIFSEIVFWLNAMQGQSLEKVSFYRLTTAFAEYLKSTFQNYNIQVTGHSLGGGLAMITGAQSSIPAVGVSGPNALISGRSFNPPVTEEQMNHYTFNIIPNRDIVPMLDDRADQYQLVRCTSKPYDFVGCHFSKRTLCEVIYTCGTGNRPALCECVTEYGYPMPSPIDGSGATD